MSLPRFLLPSAFSTPSSVLAFARRFHSSPSVGSVARSTKHFKAIDQVIQAELPPIVLGTKLHKTIPQPKGPIVDTTAFLRAAGRDLKKKVKGEVSWDQLFTWNSEKWAEAGLATKEVKYLQYIIEKYRQGYDPRYVAFNPKKAKKTRGHGPAIQNGIRVKGSFKMDLVHAPRPWGMEAFASRGKVKD